MVGIVCTGEPPFYALSNRGPPAFVPARDLQTGDTLTLADGEQASVVSLAQEFAPSGESFTTYNFEVADFHTYFAGPAGGVWVHNNAAAWCQQLFALFDDVLQTVNGRIWSACDELLANAHRHVALAEMDGHWTIRLLNDVRRRHFEGLGKGEIAPWLSELRIKAQKRLKMGEHRGEYLAENMEAMYGVKRPGKHFTPHHIVPGGYEASDSLEMRKAAKEAHDILDRFKIDINDGANGVYLRNRKAEELAEDVYGPLHGNLHTKTYFTNVAERLKNAAGGGEAAVRNELQKIANELAANQFPWKNI